MLFFFCSFIFNNNEKWFSIWVKYFPNRCCRWWYWNAESEPFFVVACEKSGDIWESLVVIKVSWRSFSSYTSFPLASYSIVVIFVIRNMSSQGGTISIISFSYDSVGKFSLFFLLILISFEDIPDIHCLFTSLFILAVNTFITLEQFINYNIFFSPFLQIHNQLSWHTLLVACCFFYFSFRLCWRHR